MKEMLNKPAPEFSAKNQDGELIKLSDLHGKWIVLYFYPKDETPGCTVQACSLRDVNTELTELSATVVGVSKDDEDSHRKFAAKHNLNFHLLADADQSIINTYGAWGPKMFGREGILRKTYLIDPDGVVRKVWAKATPQGHGDDVVDALKALQAEN